MTARGRTDDVRLDRAREFEESEEGCACAVKFVFLFLQQADVSNPTDVTAAAAAVEQPFLDIYVS